MCAENYQNHTELKNFKSLLRFVTNLLKKIFGLTKNLWIKYKNFYHCGSRLRKIAIVIVTFFVGLFLLIGAIDINFLWLFGTSPDADDLENTVSNVSSEIYSADGKLIGKYFSENRSPVTLDKVSKELINTLICTEDERFYSHIGIDFKGVFAAAKDMVIHGKTRGASTLTQQLVKNMYKARSRKYKRGLLGHIPGVKLVVMKLKEWITSFKLECKYSKEQILTMYLNTVDFGSNAYGIKTAAATYFNTLPENLTYEQSAVLVGLLKATSSYNPRTNPENSLKRRNTILQNLCENGFITKLQLDSISALPIKLDYSVEKNYDGHGLYFRDAVANSLKDWCKQNNVNLYTDGLKIYTTLDSTMQAYAEEAVLAEMDIIQTRFNNHWGKENPWRDRFHNEIPAFIEGIAKRTDIYKYYQKKFGGDSAKIFAALNVPHRMRVFDYKLMHKDTTLSTMDSIRYMVRFMHTSLVAIEPQTGYVKAWVGDLDFNFWKYDKVTAMRQPGSTFKLFDYTEALRQGMSPCDERTDFQPAWQVWDKGKKKLWIPHNADGISYNLPFSLRSAFARSINTIAVQISKEVGIANINATARRLGVKSPLNDTIPATCLGGSDMTLLELVNAYSTIINDGIYHDPVLVVKIVDRDGNVIYSAPNTDREGVDYETAYLMQQMLKGCMTEYGCTSGSLWGYVRPFMATTDFGGKTGTSSNHSDAWFVGVTPKLVAGVWVGGEYRSIHFRSGMLGQGNKTALPIFGRFIQSTLADSSLSRYKAKFPLAKTKITRPYQCKQYVTPDSTYLDSIARLKATEELEKNPPDQYSEQDPTIF